MRYMTEFINGHALIYNAEETHDITVVIVKLELDRPKIEFNLSDTSAKDYWGNDLIKFSKTKGTIEFNLVPIMNDELQRTYTFKNTDEFKGFKKAFKDMTK